MALIFKYAVLTAIPDASRGERVNVGIVVFLDDRADVRFAELAKVRALTGNDWGGYAGEVQRQILDQYTTANYDLNTFMEMSSQIDRVFKLSSPAWFSLSIPEQYEAKVGELLRALVIRPKAQRDRPKSTRINTEIARQLRQVKALATHEESIESHKVVRDWLVEDDLKADFAQKNGVMRVATTLDLRRQRVDIKEATLKAVILDRAGDLYEGSEVHRIGIYAADPFDADNFRSHIRLLNEYATATYNWQDPRERRNFMNTVYDGLGIKGPLF